jgi:hypothetical protein
LLLLGKLIVITCSLDQPSRSLTGYAARNYREIARLKGLAIKAREMIGLLKRRDLPSLASSMTYA